MANITKALLIITSLLASMSISYSAVSESSTYIGESYGTILKRLGPPNVEQHEKGLYAWALDDRANLFRILFFNDGGTCVAEQLRAYGGALTLDKAFSLFQYYLGLVVSIDFAQRGKAEFAGMSLDFGPDAIAHVDEEKGILCVWEKGERPTASVYTEEGLRLRINRADVDLFKN